VAVRHRLPAHPAWALAVSHRRLAGAALGEHFVNDLVWEVLIGGLWIAGAISDGDARLARPVGVVALVILAVATAPLTLIVGIAASTAVLLTVAIADTVHEDEQVPIRSA
jgi:hypothetical protein